MKDKIIIAVIIIILISLFIAAGVYAFNAAVTGTEVTIRYVEPIKEARQ